MPPRHLLLLSAIFCAACATPKTPKAPAPAKAPVAAKAPKTPALPSVPLVQVAPAVSATSAVPASSTAPASSVPPLPKSLRAPCDRLLAEAKARPLPPGAIIALGSSHIQKWRTLKSDLGGLDIYNFGISGSWMSHADEHFISELVIPFQPRAVLLCEGSNDIGYGASPESVLAHFRGLHRQLHEALPQCRLYVLGIVPSPGQRFARFPEIQRANALIRAECATQPWMTYIDTTSPLIGPDGLPRPECFIPGDFHMTAAGYTVWKTVIAPVLAQEKR